MSSVGAKDFSLEELPIDRPGELAIPGTDSEGILTMQAPSIRQPGEHLEADSDGHGKNQPSLSGMLSAARMIVPNATLIQNNYFGANPQNSELPAGAHLETKTPSNPSSQNQHIPSSHTSSIFQSSNAETSRVSLSQQPNANHTISELEASNIKYERHMFKKGRGFPLWIPECSHTLHIEKRQLGVEVGDVGLINKNGCFVFLFNIRLPANHPFHPKSMPAGYTPVQLLNPHDLVENNSYGPHAALTSAHIRRLEPNPATSSEQNFEIHASDGAILTLPEGAQFSEVQTDWTSYMKRHLGSWYRFVKVTLRRNVNNGDIRLVTGCDKTSCWGMAVTEQPPNAQESYRLSFRLAADENSPVRHMWACNGMVDTRVGPTQENIRKVQQKSQKPLSLFRRFRPPQAKATEIHHNQCVFITSINISLDEESWNEIERDAEELHNNGDSSSSFIKPSLSSFLGSSGTSADASKGKNSASGPPSSADPMSQLGFVNDTSLAQRLYTDNHPADWLSKFLRLLYPSAQSTVIYDEDWCFAMRNIPDPGPMDKNEVICAVLLELNFKLQDHVVQASYVDNHEPKEQRKQQTTRRVAEIAQGLPDDIVREPGALKDLIFTLDRVIYVFQTADVFRNSSTEWFTKRLADVTNMRSFGHPASSEVNFEPSRSWTVIAILNKLAHVFGPHNSSHSRYNIASAHFHHFHSPSTANTGMKTLEPLELCISELKRIDYAPESGPGSIQPAETRKDTENLHTDLRTTSLDVVSNTGLDDIPLEWKELAQGKALSQSIKQVQIQEIDRNDIIILVMGPIGSGKSSFVQAAKGIFQGSDRRNRHTITEESNYFESDTQNVECFSIEIPNQTSKLIIVDTPGFDDPRRSSAVILRIIGDWLKDTYIQKKQINGIVYMHRISDIRYDIGTGSAFGIFRKICGNGEACGRVVLTTSMWNVVQRSEWERYDEREKEIKAGPWKDMLARATDAAMTSRFDPTNEDTERTTVMQTILKLAKSARKVVLQLQKELVDEKLSLTNTTAGKAVFTVEEAFRYRLASLPKSLSLSN